MGKTDFGSHFEEFGFRWELRTMQWSEPNQNLLSVSTFNFDRSEMKLTEHCRVEPDRYQLMLMYV